MLDIRRVLREEQPRINAVLESAVTALPESVRPVAAHTLGAGGKRLRPLLAVLMGRLFGSDHPHVYTMAAAIEFVHVASLMHDDVLDNAATRRGTLSAHEAFTPTEAILCGDVMLAHAAGMVADIGDQRISRSFADAVVKTATGEIDEFRHQGNLDLDYRDYLAMITGKTAWMLRVACELPAYFAGADDKQVEAAAGFGLECGIAFQIVDDALDIVDAADTGKPSGGDIREGKCTPVVSMYLETLPPPEAETFVRKFADRSFTGPEVAAITAAMRQLGLDVTCRRLADEHLERAKQALLRLPDNAVRRMLALVPDYIRDRGN